MKNKINGLTSEEVLHNQEKYGLNELIKEKRSNFFVIYIRQFNDWLVIILIIASLLSLIVDPTSIFESFIILLILFINAMIGSIQEIKSQNTLDGLKKLSNHKVKVIRNNQNILIDPIYLTIDDIVILEKGNMIDADMIVLESNNLEVDESVLTGESLPISKIKNDHLYSLTFVVKGTCICKVIKVGMDRKIGEIAKEIISNKEEKTPLEEKLAQIGKIIGLISIFICIIVFIFELFLKISFIEAFKSAVSLAVAAIPEGLATVVTVCLAIGVKRMANENAIIKRLASVETLGCSNIICTDKTGTLTENKQKVMSIYTNRVYEIKDFNLIDKQILDILYITSKFDLNEVTDPIDVAIIKMLENLKYTPVVYFIDETSPFDSVNKYAKTKFTLNNKSYLIYKGALDVISEFVIKKPNKDLMKSSDILMEKGYRVIALANEIEVIAIIGLQDPPRKDVITTISLANTAGVKTIMITGDHAKTAYSIASELNICSDIKEVLTKEELDKLTDEQLQTDIDKYRVYARVSPIDKVRIVKAWQKNNNIVAMTGDGINDAPALKVADIGCAMGSGAEISKDCSDVILTDSNYNTIVKAIKNGRGIYDNIKRCCKYLLSSNIGEVLVIFIVLLLSLILNVNLGIPLLSIHLLWINIITDSLPAFGLGIMNPSPDIMKRDPRKKEEGFFSKGMIAEILFMGTVIGMLSVISYFIGLNVEASYASTMAFLTLSTSQLLHSYNCATDKSIFSKDILKNKFLNLSFIVGMILQILVIYVKKVNLLFKLKPLPISMFLIAMILSILVIVVSEIRKKLVNKC